MMLSIQITETTAKAILKLNNRYFFDLFKSVRINEDEEYEMRNAIEQIATKIQKDKQNDKE